AGGGGGREAGGGKRLGPKGERDWQVIVEHEGLALAFEKIIEQDLTIASKHQAQGMMMPAGIQAATNTQALAPPQKAKVPKTYFAPKTIAGNMTIQPVLTPDNFAQVIVPLIRGTKHTSVIQTQYITPPKSTPP